MAKLFCRLNVKISFHWQLRVVRAFKSTLEDLEEKRSVNSFHSFHSLRSSRSHQGPRPMSESVTIANHHERICRRLTTAFERPFPKMPVSPPDPGFRLKSQSYENVPLVSKQPSPLMAPVNPGHRDSSPKTLSQADINSITETSIWRLACWQKPNDFRCVDTFCKCLCGPAKVYLEPRLACFSLTVYIFYGNIGRKIAFEEENFFDNVNVLFRWDILRCASLNI